MKHLLTNHQVGICRGPIPFAIGLLVALPVFADEPLRFVSEKDRLVITRGSLPVVKYVFQDRQVLRPYFSELHTPDGFEVTRHNPPRKGVDPVDHATMHPGIWLAFGDLGGTDFWRNKGHVQHERFSTEPQVQDGTLRFAVVNRYRDKERLVCHEQASYTLRVFDHGYLLAWDSQFFADAPVAFGDQEEMGLGIRMATPLCVKDGSGIITSSDGKRNERQVWGTQAQWCDYSGTVERRRVGIFLMPHDDNFRKSWLHVRDYGLLVANPFGQNALGGGDRSRIEIGPDTPLRLRFGIWIYSVPADVDPDFSAVTREYSQRVAK